MVQVSENSGKSSSILIVDDNREIGDILYEKLESIGYHCYVAGSAQDALAKLGERPFDILLLDVKLPGKSGIDLLKDLKSYWADTAVIVISAVDDLDTVSQARKLWPCDYIIKPFNLNEVVLSVERMLEYRHLNHVWRRRIRSRLWMQ
jgi:DNA-binding NtrC family response regulator